MLTDSETQINSLIFEKSSDTTKEKAEIEELTTSGAKEVVEQLPTYIFSEFGEEVTKRILRGNGDLEICIRDAFITVIPDTKTIMFPINRTPLVEGWLRAPWRDAVNNFEDSFLTLKVSPKVDEPLRTGLGGLDEGDTDEGNGDLDGFTISELPKDANKDHHFFKNSKARVTFTDVKGLEESPKEQTMSPEDELNLENNLNDLFEAQIVDPGENLMKSLMPESSTVVKEYIEPKIRLINSAIGLFNETVGNNRSIYNFVDPENITTSLLYKVPLGIKDGYKKELENNLTPLVLSPTLSIYRGYRGFIEDTLIVAQTEKGWKSFLFGNSGERDLSESIDRWLGNES